MTTGTVGYYIGPNAKAKCKQSNARSTMMKVSTPTLHLDGHLIVLTYQPLIRPHHRVTVRPSRSPSSLPNDQRLRATRTKYGTNHAVGRWAVSPWPLLPSFPLCCLQSAQSAAKLPPQTVVNPVCDGSQQTGQKRKQTKLKKKPWGLLMGPPSSLELLEEAWKNQP